MVFVLNKNKKPLNPCSPARARKLLKQGKAIVHKVYPFTIRLKELKDTSTNIQEYRLKFDPGAKTTGVAMTKENEVVFLAEIEHQTTIRKNLETRRNARRGRRSRKLRYRKPRFLNRTRKKGWIPPSLQARVDNIESWALKLSKLVPIDTCSMELVKFDTQKMQNENIAGVAYQQGTLEGYEVREYLLEKFNRTCAYCEKTAIPLEVEHVKAKSRGGTNRITNLAMACRQCNEEKDNLLLAEWAEKLNKKQDKRSQTILKNLETIEQRCQKPLKDATVVNVTRWKLYETLISIFGKENVEVGSGALTKMNRIQFNLPKEHYYDAACVGFSTPLRCYFKTDSILQIKAKGRGSRFRAQNDKYGFIKANFPRQKIYFGFVSGDLVKMKIPKGKYTGEHIGFISMRSTGRSDLTDLKGNKIVQGGNIKYAKLMQRFDGYTYQNARRV